MLADGKESDDRLRDIRQIRGDAVARLDADLAQPGGEGRDAPLKVAPAHRLQRLRLARIEDRRALIRSMAKHLRRIIEGGAGKPSGARHFARCEGGRRGRREANVEEVDDRLPECFEIVDRPAPERLVIGKAQVPLLREPIHVSLEMRRLLEFGVRLPEELTFRKSRHVEPPEPAYKGQTPEPTCS